MPFRSFSRPHLRDHLPPCSLRAVAVYGGDTVRGRSFKTPYVPDVALHVFEVGESVRRSDVFRHQTVANASSTKLLENASLPGQTVAPFRAMRDRKSTRLNSSHANISY